MALQQDLLTIAIPVFNERKLHILLPLVDSLKMKKEVIIVDDGSSLKKTHHDLQEVRKKYPYINIFRHSVNKGKSEAIQTALSHAKGNVFVILDADMELDPLEITDLYTSFINTSADIVLGVRKLTHVFQQGFITYCITLFARMITSIVTFIRYGKFIKDPLVGFKMFRTDLFKDFPFSSSRFGIETEIISHALQENYSIVQVPVSYQPRSYAEGKKIHIKDGIEILSKILQK